jgi:hypothetical protein
MSVAGSAGVVDWHRSGQDRSEPPGYA